MANEGFDDDYHYDYHQNHHEQHPMLNYNGPPPSYHQHHHHHHHRPTYSPRCCDVPALQSPKNAVAPTQTLIATSGPSATLGEYTNSVQRMKSALTDYQQPTISNFVKKELELTGNSGNATNKLVYTHESQENYASPIGARTSCLQNSSARPLNYAYPNTECMPLTYGIPMASRNGLLNPSTTMKNDSVFISGEEEKRNDVAALRGQFQVCYV